MTGHAAATRERHLNSALAFLAFAKREHGLGALPTFERDNVVRNPNRRARRRVEELRHNAADAVRDRAVADANCSAK